ncbi:hypothetical protein [Hymenobacter actinosclerus]|uniref:Uncharacterized protein n=1 Tax=Hymenobacter actinosclerus TaxID=82805 RepID=A0A1I0HGM7_9BACT|nr:hypothetical protein [Hymenobacter actinosclerus]SET83128.1 hypothetical protein SAMN04487998_2928 [Hymenobacter actinosclerus]
MVATTLTSAIRPRRALLLAAGLLASLGAAAQSAPATAAANQPNPLLWLLLAGLGIIGLMLIMTVASAASAMRWSAEQAAAAAEAAPAAEVAAPVAAEAAPIAAEAAPVVAPVAPVAPVAAWPAPAAVPVYSSVEEPVLC